MKEYKIGEVFTTGDGKTVQCVRSNGLCTGCVFLTMISGAPRCDFLTEICDTPRCKARDIDCSGCSREDRQHVIFEELGELKEHTEYPVGKILMFEGRVVEVVGNNDEKSCHGCALFEYSYMSCHNILCIPVERMDEKYVKFITHVTED